MFWDFLCVVWWFIWRPRVREHLRAAARKEQQRRLLKKIRAKGYTYTLKAEPGRISRRA